MTIKQQGGIFGRNPTFNDVDATDVTSSTITATTSVSTPVETISGNTSSVAFSSNSAGMLFSGGTDATKYSGIVFRGANSWNTFLGRIPDGAADPLVIGNDAISAFGAICTFGANDVTINRGNLVIGTSGQGIDFSATSGTGTSELFDDYEEGTWTPTLTSGPTLSAAVGRYTKVGNVVYVMAKITRNDAAANSNAFELGGLPYTPDNSNPTSANGLGVAASYNGTSDRRTGIINSSNGSTVFIIKTGTAVNVTYDDFIADTRTAELKWFYYT